MSSAGAAASAAFFEVLEADLRALSAEARRTDGNLATQARMRACYGTPCRTVPCAPRRAAAGHATRMHCMQQCHAAHEGHAAPPRALPFAQITGWLQHTDYASIRDAAERGALRLRAIAQDGGGVAAVRDTKARGCTRQAGLLCAGTPLSACSDGPCDAHQAPRSGTPNPRPTAVHPPPRRTCCAPSCWCARAATRASSASRSGRCRSCSRMTPRARRAAPRCSRRCSRSSAAGTRRCGSRSSRQR